MNDLLAYCCVLLGLVEDSREQFDIAHEGSRRAAYIPPCIQGNLVDVQNKPLGIYTVVPVSSETPKKTDLSYFPMLNFEILIARLRQYRRVTAELTFHTALLIISRPRMPARVPYF